MNKKIFIFATSLLIISTTQAETDKYLWLEDVDSEQSLNWVKEQNTITNEKLTKNPLYKDLYDQALTTLNNKSRIPSVSQRGKWLYNLWKDDEYPRGVYRRTTLKNFKKDKPKWQTVLDMTKISEAENKKYSFGGMSCLPPKNRKCLVDLSVEGGDATEVKEYDLKKKRFVKNGFKIPLAKTQTSWIDKNTIFVGTDFGKGSMTKSGYPRIVKKWIRNTPLSSAQTIFTASQDAVYAYGFASKTDDKTLEFVIEATSFWTSNLYLIKNNQTKKINIPASARFTGIYENQAVISLTEDWTRDTQNFIQGEVLLADIESLVNNTGQLESIIKPTKKSIVENVTTTDQGLLVTITEDVNAKLSRFVKTKNGKWDITSIPFPEKGSINVTGVDSDTGDFFVQYESFITPPGLYHVKLDTLKPQLLKQQTPSFDGAKFKVEQYFTKSDDGTRVPYFVVMGKNTEFNGKNPTHIFSYGGFRNTLSPSYSGSYEALSGAYGKLWLERGGVFVLANIRGGGEYGPAWHEAALLKNKHKSYEDFEAVANDLFTRNITSAKHLGIEGRSNGGLLVTATMTRKPNLYGAIICGAPLIDMMRYHKLLAGASWMGEFGDPDSDEMRDYIRSYSPYQNVDPEITYPPVFFYTSTRDDRVHPGHARKMAALLKEYGQNFEYYENTEGGHKGFSTNEQLAHRLALSYTHLWTHLK